jgi:hypothetical protein
MSITEFLNSRGFYSFEGHCRLEQKQVDDLIEISNYPNIINVMEIGFNAGHSAEVFLSNNKNIHLTSFDLGSHDYVYTAKEYIDSTYQNRHTLILGDSTISVPEYIINNRDKKFDLIFIDGCHAYDIAKQDVENCIKLSHKDTIVVLDDTMYNKDWEEEWTVGPTRTWIENKNNGNILELTTKDYRPGHGMSWGKYNI